MPDPKKIRVRDTNGQLLDIDPSDLDAAQKSGAERLYQMNTHDNPKGWWVGEKDVHPALQDGAFLMSPDDFTSNLGKEGTYQMVGPGGKQPVPIKYSMVGSAAKSGYVMDPSSRQKYMIDASADPALKHLKLRPGVKAVGRNTAGQPMVAPDTPDTGLGAQLEQIPGAVLDVATGVAKGAGDFLNPTPTPSEKERIDKSGFAGKVIESLPIYPFTRMAEAQVAQGQQAIDAAKRPPSAGNVSLAIGHGLAAAVPFVGPIAAQAGEQLGTQVGSGQYGSAAGTLAGNTLLMAAPHLMGPLSSVLGNSYKAVPEGVRAGIRRTLGVTDKTEDLIKNFGKESDNVRDKNQAATEKTLGKRGAVDEANKKAMESHQNDVSEHGKKVQQIKEQHDQKAAKAQKKRALEEKNHKEATEKVQKDNAQAQLDHIKEVERIAKDKQAAQGIDNQRQMLTKQVADQSRDLQGRIRAAEKNAKAADDQAWDAWRVKMDKSAAEAGQQQATANMKPVLDEINSQSANMTPKQVSEFRDILEQAGDLGPDPFKAAQDAAANQAFGTTQFPTTYDALEDNKRAVIDKDLAQRGITPASVGTTVPETPVSRLHGWKGELERAVRTAKDGNVKHAIGKVLDQVRKLEVDVSKKYGADAELKAARALHGPYVEAFVNSPNEAPTVASDYLKKVAPDFVSSDRLIEQGKQLEAYDPEISKLGAALEEAQNTLKSLPTEAEVRKMASQEVPQPPPPNPLPAALEPPEALKEPVYPAPPTPPEPKPYEEPESTTPRPDTGQVPEEIKHTLNRGLRRYGAVGGWVLRSIVGGMAEHFAHGSLSTFGSTMLMGQAAVSLLTDALRRSSVLEWLAKPTAEELKTLDSLNPDDAARLRQALAALAAEDVSKLKGKPLPPFDPVVSQFLLGASAAGGQKETLEELKKQAQKQAPKQQAAPGPQSNAEKPVWTHEYDPERGIIRAVNA